jgi:polygalacturonase
MEALVAGAAVTGPSLVAHAAASPSGSGKLGIFDVTAFGAVGDGRTLVTPAIQKAVDACGKAGGGLVLVPPGRYLTGAIFLRSNIEFHLAAGATLLASQRFQDFPPIDGRWEGVERKTHSSLLTGERLDNVTLSGGGVLDGQGAPWWAAFEATHKLRRERGLAREAPDPPDAPLKWPCPRLINLIRCQRVSISDLAMENGPSWNLHLIYCQDVTIQNVAMVGLEAQEACGVVLDSCKRVRVVDCSIASGADCIGIKAGYNEDGRRVGLPCESILISNCNLFDSFSAGISIGSETAGGINNILVTNCVIEHCKNAFHIRSTRGRGGGIERVRITNCVVDGLSDAAIVVRQFFDSVLMESYAAGPKQRNNPETNRAMKPTPGEGTPTFRDLHFSGLTVGSARELASIEGLPERFIQTLKISDVSVAHAKGGISCQNAVGVRIADVRLDPLERPLVTARNVQRLELDGLTCAQPPPRAPVVELENVAGAFIRNCQTAASADRFVVAKGTANHKIVLAGNSVGGQGEPARGK